MSSATTLRELKADLDANNISYVNMAFYEGTARVELKTDDSILPHDVPYKGTITNELVIMLSLQKKKIKSGAYTRADLYSLIKKYRLQDKCISTFNRNYTQCKTEDLNKIVTSYINSITPCAANPIASKKEEVKETSNVENKSIETNCKLKEEIELKNIRKDILNIKQAINIIANALEDVEGIEYVYDDVMEVLERDVTSIERKDVEIKKNPVLESPYSKEDIDDMLKDLI
jgi:hypothetical protein